MRNDALRASWIVTALALVVAIGTPVVSTVGRASEPDLGQRSVGSVRAGRHPFTDHGPVVVARAKALRARNAASDARAARRHERRRLERAASTHLLVRVPHSMTVHARPRAGSASVGTMPSGSKYYGIPITAWVEETAEHGRWGRVEIPYVWPRREGWIPLRGLARSSTHVEVQVDLSRHRLSVSKFGRTLFVLPAATGAPVSPTPPGEYFVTDRIPFPSGGSLGAFAFGISGIQPHLPPGWGGGNQLAIHGTNDPSSIGTSASAGCLRVSEQGLDRLLPLLKLGTPVLVQP